MRKILSSDGTPRNYRNTAVREQHSKSSPLSSSTKYILYITSLHLGLGVLAYRAFTEEPIYILVAEAALLLSAYIAFRIYRSIIAPVRLLSQGAAALEDQDFSVKLLPTGSKEMDGVVTVYNQMIDQLRSERVSGKQREEFLDRILASAQLGIAILDFDGNVTSKNGWLEEKSASPAFRETVLQPALHLRQRPTDDTMGLRTQVLNGPGGRRYHVDLSSFVDRGFERGFIVIQDVTAELLSAEKEAYGKVIRMMAHEVNNTNAGVVSILKTLLEAAQENDPKMGQLTTDYLPAAIQRVDNMTDFIRNFARVVRLPAPALRSADLNEVMQRTVEVMHQHLSQHKIECSCALAAKPVLVDMDVAQIEQVIVNALINAQQSIGTDGQIEVTVQAYPSRFTIADNGPGISQEDAASIFTPFFSTKATGQGIGLTLAREILEAHRATYSLATEADCWTRFKVQFPEQRR
ncbi:PAS domain-containing sensor histidine kinase [Lewinella sp. 4G2]|uniref:sensor histidine kinase n=1 Tax=Lewinella sp. 4G2 TaxID=1803372 RepID=UPI0009ED777A|nr:ATP-binding protein [Lewinella sp. 4G2]